MHSDNWDDLRFVLAVADSGSVSAAARTLRVNHATVLRRIAAFEERQGATVFLRTRNGYQVPPDRQRVIDAAREVEAAVDAVQRVMKGAEAHLSGVIRVTSTDSLCTALLPDVIAEVMAELPELKIELYSSNAHLDLARLHADIAVRPAMALEADLHGEKAAMLRFGLFAGAGGSDDLPWLTLSGILRRTAAASWMAANLAPGRMTNGSDSFLVLREMAAAGLGLAVLPMLLGKPDARLRRVAHTMPDFDVPVWVALHADMADVPRLRAVRSRLGVAIAARAGALRGD